MADKIIKSFDVWIAAQGVKSKLRLRNVDNISLEGIGRLRELILELAIRGKLVPQDPSNDTAQNLLNRIRNEKNKLLNDGTLKKAQRPPAIDEDRISFLLPEGWDWTYLGEIGNIFNGNSINVSEKEAKYTGVEGRPFIATKDVGYGWDELDYSNGILIPYEEKNFRIARKGTVLLCAEGGSAGKKCGVTNQDICFGNKLLATELFGEIDENYLLSFFQTPSFYQSFKEKMTGIIGGISISKFAQIRVPLPPPQEQRKIASKVLELMALCYELEREETNHLKSHQLLVETLLGTLTQAKDATDFQNAWGQLTQHFDELFTTEGSIDQLKQTILQLAVMGKLVPQDPNDEPAGELLKRIEMEKERLVKKGKIKKQKTIVEISDDEKFFDLPKGWEWCRLSQISEIGTGATPLTSNPEYYNGDIPWITSSATNEPFVEYAEESISKKAIEETNCKVYPKGTLILAMYGQGKTRGQITELLIDAATNQACAAIELIENEIHHKKYIKYYFKKIYDEIRELAAGGAQPNLNLQKVKDTIISLPPFVEQQRITNKVDDLFALCDRLKERIVESQKVANQMAEAVLEQEG